MAKVVADAAIRTFSVNYWILLCLRTHNWTLLYLHLRLNTRTGPHLSRRSWLGLHLHNIAQIRLHAHFFARAAGFVLVENLLEYQVAPSEFLRQGGQRIAGLLLANLLLKLVCEGLGGLGLLAGS